MWWPSMIPACGAWCVIVWAGHMIARTGGELRAVAVDDTATRKGHRYATVVLEIDPQQTQPARLLYRTPERTTASVGEFAAAMPAHGAKPDQVRLAAVESINSIIPRHAIAPEASATSTTSKPSATGWSAISTCKLLQHLPA